MATKLTNAQREMLGRLAGESTAIEYIHRYEGKRAQQVVFELSQMGLIKEARDEKRPADVWALTDTGRAALEPR